MPEPRLAADRGFLDGFQLLGAASSEDGHELLERRRLDRERGHLERSSPAGLTRNHQHRQSWRRPRGKRQSSFRIGEPKRLLAVEQGLVEGDGSIERVAIDEGTGEGLKDHCGAPRVSRRVALYCAAALLAFALAFAPTPAGAQMVVYDPNNYAQNVLTAARALQQVNNQITSLQNQTQMLLNQARNLVNLPYSSLQAIEQSIARTQQLLNQAQRIAYDITQIDQAFQRIYPQGYTGSTSSQQLIIDAQQRWQNSLAAHQDAMHVQAGVVQALDTTRSQSNALLSASQSATGSLQALQAGNQLIALQTRQLADLTALVAAQGRAQSLEGARGAANQTQAQQQLTRFLDAGQGYQPQTVQMFH